MFPRAVPLTFPVHAAPALPLSRLFGRALPPLALVMGTMAPDFAYLGHAWAESHTYKGVLPYSLPVGLLAYVIAELWVFPSLRRTLPVVRGVELARWTMTRGLPRSVVGWLGAAVAVTVGALTHVLWDGFTHVQMWPARVLYPHVILSLAGTSLSLATLLQQLCSVLGTVFILAWAVPHTRTLAPAPAPPSGLFWRIAAPLVLGSVLGVSWHAHLVDACYTWPQELWMFAWSMARGGSVGLLLGCGLERLGRPHPSASGT